MNKEELEVLAENDVNSSFYYCVYNSKIADIKAHERVILNSGDPYYCCVFAKKIPGANIRALEKVVLESNDTYYCNLLNKYIACLNSDYKK